MHKPAYLRAIVPVCSILLCHLTTRPEVTLKHPLSFFVLCDPAFPTRQPASLSLSCLTSRDPDYPSIGAKSTWRILLMEKTRRMKRGGVVDGDDGDVLDKDRREKEEKNSVRKWRKYLISIREKIITLNNKGDKDVWVSVRIFFFFAF